MQSMTPGVIAIMERLDKMNLTSIVCSVCKVHVSSEIVMEGHVKGKKHIKLEQRQKKQAASAAQSIYVRGVPPGSTADQLTEFFQQFGTVNKVVLDRHYGHYAIIEFNEESTAKSLLSKSSVFMDNSRLTIRPRQVEGVQSKQKGRRVPQCSPQKPSSALSSTTTASTELDFEQIKEKLKACSSLEEEMDLLLKETSLSPDEVVIRQNILNELEAFLQRNFRPDCKVHLFGSSVNGLGTKGCDLDLFLDLRLENSSSSFSTLSKMCSEFGRQNIQTPCDSHDSVVPANNNSMTRDDSVTCENDESATCENDESATCENDDSATCENDESATCENDESATCENDESATCENDESLTCENDESATCENDESVTCENDESATRENDESATCENDDSATRDKDTTKEKGIRRKKGKQKTLVMQTSKALKESIKKISNLLRKRKDVYAQIVRVLTARCPVVKFIHLLTSLKCDLSINNRLGLRNTSLIQFLLSFDSRIRPLAFSIRQWAKVQGVAGQMNAGPTLTNYALTMIVFFYLQSRSPPILPSINRLSNLAENPCVVDGWDCSFTSDLTKLQPEANISHCSDSEKKSEKRETLGELLCGFFEFYAKLDFSLKVICLREGKSIDLNSFSEQMTSDPHLKDFKISPLMIQDPFVLNHNIASNVSEKLLLILQTELKAAATNCRTRLTSATAACPRPNLIPLLYSEASTPLTHPKAPHLHDMPPTASHRKGSRAGAFSFTVKVEASKLMMEALRQKKTFAEMQEEWCNNSVTIVRHTLKIFDIQSCLVEQQGEQVEGATTEGAAATCHAIQSDADDLQAKSGEVADRMIQSEKTVSDLANRPSDCETHDDESCPHDKIEICLKDANHCRKRCSSKDDDGKEPKRPKSCSEQNNSTASSSEQNDSTENDSIMQNYSRENSCTEKGAVECVNATDKQSNDSEQCKEKQSQMPCPAFSAECSTHSRLWIGRKKLRKQLSHLKTGDYEKEVQVSQILSSQEKAPEQQEMQKAEGDALLKFKIFLSTENSPSTGLTVSMETEVDQKSKEFSGFFFSFRSVVEKLVDTYGTEDIGKWKKE